jgi:hypothetical protein
VEGTKGEIDMGMKGEIDMGMKSEIERGILGKDRLRSEGEKKRMR